MRIKTVEISDAAADVLRRGRWDGATFILPDGKLERPLYEAVDKALRALGGKWNRGKGGHVFATDAKDQLVAALDAGSVVDQKKTLEQFFTPQALADEMARLAGVNENSHVLEPSAGSGRLVYAATKLGAIVTAVEIDFGLITKLDDVLHGSVFHFRADFMAWSPASPIPIDIVLMNPPFSNGQDVQHVTRALSMLAPGGTLVAIMSPHWTFANDAISRGFRELIGAPVFQLREPTMTDTSWEPAGEFMAGSVKALPEGTFKESGTNVRTLMVRIIKSKS